MSDIFDNAVVSIRLGIEDFNTDNDARMLSAARNYYAGLLLLAKECLVNAAPKADAMEVIGAKFVPKPDGDGGVRHEVTGYTTVDLRQLRERFKIFGLPWPKADIAKLQRYRNDLEHYHLKEPASALGEAIASSFPMIVDFFEILGEDPQEHLSNAWDTILKEREIFDKVQKQCLDGFSNVHWPASVEFLDRMSCPECGSSLIGQDDPDNENHEHILGRCHKCGAEIHFEKMMELVVASNYEISAYLMVKNGENSPIATCPECDLETYAQTESGGLCFVCGVSVDGECARCGTGIDVHEYNSEYPELCSYCVHMLEKVMAE